MKGIKKTLSVFLAGAVLVATTSCKKNKGTQPTIPPAETFQMETADFDDSKTGPQRLDGTATATNWTHSAWHVGVWNIVLTITLIVPVAAYWESFNHTPKYVSDKKGWRWKYTVNVLGIDHTCKLYGKVSGDNVNWEMYLTKAGHYKNFLWYKGTSDLANNAGQWIMYSNPNDPAQFLQMDWSRDADGNADVKYTNVTTGAAKDDYIHYGIQAGNYDRFYRINDQSESRLIDIEWNFASKYGHVKDNVKFGDTNWHCWGNNLHDTICP